MQNAKNPDHENSIHKMVFETVRDAILIIDAETASFEEVNDYAIKMYGYSRKEFLGMTVYNITEKPELAKTAIKDTLGRKQLTPFERTHKKKDGTKFPVEIVNNVMRQRGKKKICSVIRDITERKKIEDSIANERKLLRTLIDNLPDHIYFKDNKSRFLLNNKSHRESLGIKHEQEILGKTDFDFYPRNFAEQYFEDEKQLVNTGEPQIDKEEKIEVQTTGEIRSVTATKIPLLDSKGKIWGIVGITKDITVQKKQEEKLRLSIEELSITKQKLEEASEEINTELEMAHEIQRSLLPEKLPQIPGYRFAVDYVPTGLVGGDFYYFKEIDRHHLLIVEADVSGHGVPAAFVTAMAKAFLDRNEIDANKPLRESIKELNDELCKNIKTEHYITAFISLLNIPEGTMRYARICHPYPAHYRAHNRSVEFVKDRSGFFLGIEQDDSEFSESSLTLAPGDKLLIYTDGFVEGFDKRDNVKGRQMLGEKVRELGDLEARPFLHGINKSLYGNEKSIGGPDDITALVIEKYE